MTLKEKLATTQERMKKYSRRAREKVLQKLGQHESTNDPIFDDKVTKAQMLDQHLQLMYDAVTDYLSAQVALQSAGVRMGMVFNEIVETDDEVCITPGCCLRRMFSIKGCLSEKKKNNVKQPTHFIYYPHK